MMRTLAMAGAAALALAAPAFAQPGPMAQPGAMPAAEFVRMAGASDKFEITEAQIARTRAHDPQVRRFADQMIRAHTESTMKVKAAATRTMGHPPPPPMLMPEQQSMVAELKAAPPAQFDKVYLQQQEMSHRQALQLMQGYAANGAPGPLKDTAAQIAPVVQSHIEMLREIGGA